MYFNCDLFGRVKKAWMRMSKSPKTRLDFNNLIVKFLMADSISILPFTLFCYSRRVEIWSGNRDPEFGSSYRM